MARRPSENAVLSKIARVFGSFGPGIRSGKKGASARKVSLGVGDDAALLQSIRGYETILTCDWFLEGTHFLRDRHPADSVGWKCLARAVSDIAAMGGAPRCFLLSLALPEDATDAWLTEFLRGLRRAAVRFDCLLVGGDTTRRDQILINITVVGEVPNGRALRRSGARAGDLLYVSGCLGEAEHGLRLLREHRGMANRRDPRLQKHLYPQPRVALGAWLGKTRLATAAMDLSDGLSSDLPRLCAASGVGARLNPAKVPHLSGSVDAQKLALHGGDDYELLFTVRAEKARQIPASFMGVPLTGIGEITASRKIIVVGRNSRPTVLEPRGWDPFRKYK